MGFRRNLENFRIQSCNKRTDGFFSALLCGSFLGQFLWIAPFLWILFLSLEFFRSQNCQQQPPPLISSIGLPNPSIPPPLGGVFFISFFSTGSHRFLENLVYHFFRQLWLVLGVKLMEISSNWFSRLLFF